MLARCMAGASRMLRTQPSPAATWCPPCVFTLAREFHGTLAAEKRSFYMREFEMTASEYDIVRNDHYKEELKKEMLKAEEGRKPSTQFLLHINSTVNSRVKEGISLTDQTRLLAMQKFLEVNLGMEKREFRRALIRHRLLQGVSMEHAPEKSVDLLKSKVGLSNEEIRRVVIVTPKALQIKRLSPKIDFMLEELGLSSSAAGDLFRYSAKHVMAYSVDGNMRPLWSFYSNALGVSADETAAAVVRCANLLGKRAPAKLEKCEDFYRNELGLSRDEIQMLAVQQPSLMMQKKEVLNNVVEFMVKKVGLSRGDIVKTLSNHPDLVHMKIDELDEKMLYFKNELSFDVEDFKRMVVYHPSVMRVSLNKTMRWVVKYLINDVRISREQLTTLAKAYPPVLCASVATQLRPTLSVLKNDIGLGPAAIEEVLKDPELIMAPLHDVTLPRTEYAAEIKVDWDIFRSNVRELLKCDDSRYCEILGCDKAHFDAWIKKREEQRQLEASYS